MFSQEKGRWVRKLLTLATLGLCLITLLLPPASLKASADSFCCTNCDEQLSVCQQNCVDTAPCPGPRCGPYLLTCYEACQNQRNACIENCIITEGSCE